MICHVPGPAFACDRRAPSIPFAVIACYAAIASSHSATVAAPRTIIAVACTSVQPCAARACSGDHGRVAIAAAAVPSRDPVAGPAAATSGVEPRAVTTVCGPCASARTAHRPVAPSASTPSSRAKPRAPAAKAVASAAQILTASSPAAAVAAAAVAACNQPRARAPATVSSPATRLHEILTF